MLSDGCTVPVPADSVTLAYSFQVMEHIHPDDALEQLRNLFTAIAPGGSYMCVTPSRLNGPHDVSKFFDPVARGFHLKEYTNAELARLFRAVGFSRVVPYAGFRGRYLRLPIVLRADVRVGVRQAASCGSRSAWARSPYSRTCSRSTCARSSSALTQAGRVLGCRVFIAHLRWRHSRPRAADRRACRRGARWHVRRRTGFRAGRW